MSTSKTCPDCGTELTPDAPAGVCPICLLKAGMNDPMAESADTTLTSASAAPADAAAIPPTEHGGDDSMLAFQAFAKVKYFGDYQLLEEIARGGMGVVYRARQTSLNRTVALKMILAGQLAGEQEVQRFHAEAEAAAQLDHPGIVPIFEVGQHEGRHYFSMGFVDGESLAERVKAGPLPPTDSAAIVKQVAEAVAYAHEHGVVHRDLKPANVLTDRSGQPRVTDFGLAKRVEGDSGLTATGQVVGTPSYMPPEQAGGKPDEVGPLADVYSLGAILYCLLTGRPPFQADNPLDTLMQVLERDPVSLRQLNPKIPRDLETICAKCMEKDRRHRYQSTGEVVSELQSFLNGEPIRARPITRAARLWRWCCRKPVHAGLGAAAAVLALSLGLVAWRGALQADWERERHLYLAHMQLARHAWEHGDIQTVEEILNRYRTDKSVNELRGWEFSYLDSLCHRDLVSLESFKYTGLERRDAGWFPSEGISNLSPSIRHVHRTGISELHWDPDGSRLVAGCMDGSVRIWDTTTATLRKILWPEPAGPVYSVAWSPEGKRIAATAIDDNGFQTLCIWNLESEELTLGIPLGRGGHPRIGFMADGKCVYRSDATGLSIMRWDAATGEELPGPQRTARSVLTAASGVLRGPEEKSPDGQWLVSQSSNGLKLRDSETGDEVHTLEGPGGIVSWSPNSKLLAWGPPAGWVHGPHAHVWDVASGRPVFSLRTGGALDWCPNEKHLATAGTDEFVRVFDTTGHEVATLRGHTGTVNAVRWNPDGIRIASADEHGVIKVWDWRTSQDVSVLDQRKVDRNLLADFELTQPAIRLTASRRCLAWSPDSTRLAAGGDELTIWDLATQQPTRVIRSFDWIDSVAWSPDSNSMVCGVGRAFSGKGEKFFVVGFEATTNRELFRLPHDGAINALCLSPDGSRLATMQQQHIPVGERRYRSKRRLRVWDLSNRKIELDLEADSFPGYLRWSLDGRYLVSGAEPWNPQFPHEYPQGRARSWDLTSGKEVDPPMEHLTPFSHQSPDGKRWVFGRGERVLDLWDSDTREIVLRLKAPVAVSAAVWSPDGQWVSAAGDDGSVALWDGRHVTDGRRQQRRAIWLVKALLRSTDRKDELIAKVRNDEMTSESVREKALELVEPLWYGQVRVPALRITELLFAKPVLKSDAIHTIRDAANLSEAIRNEAILLAQDWPQSPSDLNQASWNVVCFPNQTDEQYQEALAAAEAACRKKPDDGAMLNTLGVARYRARRFEEALTTLRQADQLNGGIPADLAFIAMSLYQLDEKELAQKALTRLRRRMSPGERRQDSESQRFLREATELIQVNHPD